MNFFIFYVKNLNLILSHYNDKRYLDFMRDNKIDNIKSETEKYTKNNEEKKMIKK